MRTLQCREAHRPVNNVKPLFIAAIFLLFFSALAQAQDKPQTERGFHPGQSYALSDIETISMSSGNMMLSVPLGALPPGRGGSPGFQLSLIYNSKLYDTHIDEVPNDIGVVENRVHLNSSKDGGWQYAFPTGYQMRLISRRNEGPTPGCNAGAFEYQKNAYLWKMTMIYPDGSEHIFRPFGYSDQFNDNFFIISANGWEYSASSVGSGDSCSGTFGEQFKTSAPIIYYSTDGSYTRLVVEHGNNNDHVGSGNPWTLYFSDGRRVSGNRAEPQRMYDRNNNFVDQVRTIYNGHPAWKIIDEYGRNIIVEEVRETDPATGRLIHNQDFVYIPGFGGEMLRWTVKWKSIDVVKKYLATVQAGARERGNTYTTPLHMAFEVVDQIIVPEQAGGLTYSFGYNAKDADGDTTTPTFGFGEVNSITLPSGAKATYAWALDAVEGASSRLPEPENVMNDKPARKQLIYREESDRQYNQSLPATTTPCDPNTEQCTTEVWVYSPGDSGGVLGTEEPYIDTITGPDGGVTQEFVYSKRTNPFSPFVNRSFKTIMPSGIMIERLWVQNRPSALSGLSVNPVVKTEFTSIKDAAGNYVKTMIKDNNYDENGNVTQVKEYDWVSYADIHDPSTGALRIPAGAVLNRVTNNDYWCGPNSYWHATAPQLLNAVRATEVSNGTTILSRSEFFYDDALKTGNLTEQRNWDSTKGDLNDPDSNGNRLISSNSISVKNEYDPNVLGKRLRSIDANDARVEFVYDPVTSPDGRQTTDLYPTQLIAAFGTVIQRTTKREYDFSTGLVTRTTDVDNGVSTRTEYDLLGRPRLVVAAEGTPQETQTQTQYFDSERRIVVRADQSLAGDGKLVSVQHYDQKGRVRLTRTLEEANVTQAVMADERVGIKVQTRYLFDAANHCSYKLVSNAYRAGTSAAASAEETMGWVRAKSFADRRDNEMESFAGPDLPAPWGVNARSTGVVKTTFDAEFMTATDQAFRVRRSRVNGLEQIVRVDEPDADSNSLGLLETSVQATSYEYDALGNLRKAIQGGQVRTFQYSSLSRLMSATNPEMGDPATARPGITTYTYDGNGNLLTRTDARGVTTTNVYDKLNRVTSRTYTDGTPEVSFIYDDPGVANSRGRLTSVSSSVSTYNYIAYDALGRVTSGAQITDGQTYTMGYGYDLSGHLTRQTYPSGKVINTTYDPIGRVMAVTDVPLIHCQKGSPCPVPIVVPYASEFTYTVHGAVSNMVLGNGLTEHTTFNSRLQPTQTWLGRSATEPAVLKLNYSYDELVNSVPDPTRNNGNLQSQRIVAPGLDLTQSYSYDWLNRLKSAREVNNAIPCRDQSGAAVDCWRQVFKYDRYGNRAFDAGTTLPALPSNLSDMVNNPRIDSSTDRLVEDQDDDGQKDYGYDAAGNVTRDATGRTFAYDAENRQTSFNGGAAATQTGGASYFYDGDGRRVKKVTQAGTTLFAYDAMGKLIAEYSAEAQQSPNGRTQYLTADTLGSTRVVTDQSGTVVARHDYAPFGGELSVGRTDEYRSDTIRQKFASYERDTETGLDFVKARYYVNALGRFMSIDPSGKSILLSNPQTWNGYSYCLNNPLRYVDDNGKWPTETHNKIIEKAFPGMSKRQLEQVKTGSARVDVDLSRPVKLFTENTMVESMAPRHAMTPGFMVAKLGSVSAAQSWARGEASKWIDQNMGEAKSIYNNSQNKDHVPDAALQRFGAGAHTIMDGSSPAHKDFQVYNLVQPVPPVGSDAGSLIAAGIGTVANSVESQNEHGDKESREPTEEEMNHMVDDMRMQYLNAFGREMYEKAVPQSEREATERRKNPRN
jgi:RHS repeat-associated protein